MNDHMAAQGDIMLRSWEENEYENTDGLMAALKAATGPGPLLELHRYFAAKYGSPKLGTSRLCYVSRSCVFKVPYTPEGFYLNDAEGSLIGHPCCEAENLARTILLYKYDIPIVVMEKIAPLSPQEIRRHYGDIPDWVYAIDMAQVGFGRKGILKAYDYADLL
jgi:hypothetical protein